MAVASLVLGICSLVIPGIGPILGIIGIVLGAMARRILIRIRVLQQQVLSVL